MISHKRYQCAAIDELLNRDISPESGEEFPVRKFMARYCQNLLKKIELSQALFDTSISLLGRKARLKLLASLFPRGESEVDYYDYIIGFPENMYRYADDILCDLRKGKFPMDEKDFADLLAGLLEWQYHCSKETRSRWLNRRLQSLRDIFGLGDDEIEIILFLFCYNDNNSPMEKLGAQKNFQDYLGIISLATGVAFREVKYHCSDNGALYRSGIVQKYNHKKDGIELDESICFYLAGMSEGSLVDQYVRRDTGPVFNVSSFGLGRKERDMIISLLRTDRPCNILFYGEAGTGKTELARSIIRSAGKRICTLKYGEETGGSPVHGRGNRMEDRLMALRVAEKSIDPGKGVIIADEADFLINTRSFMFAFRDQMDKGWLNTFLENSRAQVIWISNETGMMEESTLRRFHYSIRFKEFNPTRRAALWKNILKGHPMAGLIDGDVITRLSKQYRVNAGGIAAALACASTIHGERPEDRERIIGTIEEVLGKHESLLHGDVPAGNALLELAGEYDITALNTDGDANAIVKAACRRARARTMPQCPMNLLFWGPPGTGKTEFAKYLARQSGLGLLAKRYSDLESMWVGETEKNIRRAFQEAADTGSILFIDEADSFFTSRERAFRSWEVSRTNELLTQMENHRGILICCTNLLPEMDRAAMRRFSWKVRFKPLADDMKIPLYVKYFPLKGKKLTPAQEDRIRAIDGLTPGDLRSVITRFGFAPDKGTHGDIIDALEKEILYRRDDMTVRVGFS